VATKRLRRARTALALPALLCLLSFVGAARAQGPRAFSESPLPAPTGYGKYVTDTANAIDPATEERLLAILNNLKERADIEFAVVTVPTTGDTPIFDYSLSVARGWGIGAKEGEQNSLLLLVAVNDRKAQVQVSRRLEGDLPDGLAGEIARSTMREPFRQGDYTRGIAGFVETTVATLGQKRGFSVEGIDQSRAYRPAPRGQQQRQRERLRRGGGINLGACCCIMALVVVVLLALGRGGRGGGGRGGFGGGGWLNALLLANLFSTLAGGSRGGSSGWGGGGTGWGGGGGGGFGGFGGGGDFGGGGAGIDW